MKISICISTYKRHDYLRELLFSINNQSVLSVCSLEAIVVDNDATGSSQLLVKQLENDVKYKLRYAVEEKRGIPQSRNKAVSMVDADTDFIIFIDDDEVADNEWIKYLLLAQSKYGADLVVGTVYPRFVVDPKKWIIKGKYFIKDYSKCKTGDILSYKRVKTSNLLIKFKLIQTLDSPFNEDMAFTGGSDTELAYRLSQQGCKIIWCKEAVVYEWITQDRATLFWILQRGYRTANSSWMLSGDKSLRKRILLVALGLIRIILALIFLIPSLIISLFLGFQVVVAILRIIIRGIGFITGSLGFEYQEYKIFYNS